MAVLFGEVHLQVAVARLGIHPTIVVAAVLLMMIDGAMTTAAGVAMTIVAAMIGMADGEEVVGITTIIETVETTIDATATTKIRIVAAAENSWESSPFVL